MIDNVDHTREKREMALDENDSQIDAASVGNNIFVQIRFLYQSLTKTERNIADLILSNEEEFAQFNVAECARRAKCSEITINRFCKRLGMNGFTELKKSIMDAAMAAYDFGRYRIRKSDTMIEMFNKIAWHYMQTLKDTASMYDEESYLAAYQAIQDAKSLHFFGVGDAYAVCQMAQIKFLRIGIRCSAPSDLACMLSTACMLGPGDVAIGISYSGSTRAVNESLRCAKENGATTIGIVHLAKTAMAKFADIELYTMTVDQSDANDEIARRIAEQAIIETLYMKLVTENRSRFQTQAQKSIVTIIANK